MSGGEETGMREWKKGMEGNKGEEQEKWGHNGGEQLHSETNQR